ncbi:MAG: outer membrane protein assembly factor BamD, partial [bacterium]|nr:outer membrane protein assembly factor BamD [bacterium]
MLCKKQEFTILFLCALFFCTPVSVQAQTARDYITAGKTALASGDYPTAITNFQHAMRIALSNSQEMESAQFYLIKCYCKQNDEQNMLNEYNQLLTRNPNSPARDDLDYLLGTYFYETKKDYSTALGYFRHLVETYPNSSYVTGTGVIPAQLLLIKCYYHLNDEANMLAEYARVQRENPRSPLFDDLDYLFGTYYFETKQSLDTALQYYQHLVTAYPASPYVASALFSQMRVYYALKNHTALSATLTQLQTQYPDSAVMHAAQLLYGKSLRDNAQLYPEALAAFQTVLDRYPTSASAPEAALEIGNTWCFNYRDNLDGFRNYAVILEKYQSVIDHYPKTKYAARSQYMLSYTYHHLGKIDQASAAAQMVLDNPAYANFAWQQAHARYMLAFCKYQKQQYAEAINEYQALITQYPSVPICPEAQREIVRCYYFSGNVAQALSETEKILINYPNSPVAAEAEKQIGFLREKVSQSIALVLKDTKPEAEAAQASATLIPSTLCGPLALKTICDYYGIPAEVKELAHTAGTNTNHKNGTSLLGLVRAAEEKGFETVALKVNYRTLAKLPLPTIAHINGNHFVTLQEVNHRYVAYTDGTNGTQQMPVSTFRKVWQGFVLVLATPNQNRGNQPFGFGKITRNGFIRLTEAEMEQIYGGCLPDECWDGCPNHDPTPPCPENSGDGCCPPGGAGGDGGPGIGGGRGGDGPVYGISAWSPNRLVNLGRGNTYSMMPGLTAPINGDVISVALYYASNWSPWTGGNKYTPATNPYGQNMKLNADITLNLTNLASYIDLRKENGSIRRHYREADGNYYSHHSYGEYTFIRPISGGYVLERRDGTKLYFNSDGRLTEIKNRNNVSQYLSYDANTRLTAITDGGQRGLFFHYGIPAGDAYDRLTTLRDHTGRTVRYTYATHRLTRITYPDGYYLEFAYDPATTYTEITALRDSYSGSTALYTYTYSANEVNGVRPCVKITDALGNITEFSEAGWWNYRSV